MAKIHTNFHSTMLVTSLCATVAAKANWHIVRSRICGNEVMCGTMLLDATPYPLFSGHRFDSLVTVLAGRRLMQVGGL